ncbi:enoyl-CoA hydratase/isomerase family protein [Pseudomonas sp. NBRC 100443]|uniref:enoyl-CoA hydratase/isomerase family protein n=1 Tax=Pseudomonas sp. NBRC 100443 TaxID=1113665 RepID=UPI0024A06579|nr:enoyl-CoA hydratase/isomerase family protein [Pseudomonas sp. NBRC 100443]GLU39246.1 enoyl-CoA hydratase [Pseudomonas sp. NBRC 100443]
MSVRLDHPVEGLWRLLIDRPEKRNAIDFSVRQALIEALDAAVADRDCRAVVIGGVGGTFSAGGDIASMDGLDEIGARDRMRHIHALCQRLQNLPMPLVAAVQGYCAGAGAGMAMFADLIVCEPQSKFLFPFLRLGLAPDWGLLRTLPARLGPARARRLLLGGETVGGEEAVRLGLADELAVDDAMVAALRIAARLAELPHEAFRQMKSRLAEPAPSFAEELQREEDDQVRLLLGDDFREGFAAFNEKREPRFRQREDGSHE